MIERLIAEKYFLELFGQITSTLLGNSPQFPENHPIPRQHLADPSETIVVENLDDGMARKIQLNATIAMPGDKEGEHAVLPADKVLKLPICAASAL